MSELAKVLIITAQSNNFEETNQSVIKAQAIRDFLWQDEIFSARLEKTDIDDMVRLVRLMEEIISI